MSHVSPCCFGGIPGGLARRLATFLAATSQAFQDLGEGAPSFSLEVLIEGPVLLPLFGIPGREVEQRLLGLPLATLGFLAVL